MEERPQDPSRGVRIRTRPGRDVGVALLDWRMFGIREKTRAKTNMKTRAKNRRHFGFDRHAFLSYFIFTTLANDKTILILINQHESNKDYSIFVLTCVLHLSTNSWDVLALGNENYYNLGKTKLRKST